MLHWGKQGYLPTIFCLILALSACGGDDDGSSSSSGTQPSGTASSVPMISGSPQRKAKVNQTYTFQPTVTSTSGSMMTTNSSGNLKFKVSSKPDWATFNERNGRLTGKPQQQDIGTYDDVTISVVDDQDNVSSLEPFTIEVVQYGEHSVTLSWLPPVENEDGSALTDLAGYRIRYGQSSGNYETQINVDNVGLTTWIVDGLVPSTYFFTVTAYNAKGIESNFSNETKVAF
jgi:hypothetical protein